MIGAVAKFVPNGNPAQWCEQFLRAPVSKAVSDGCTLILNVAKEYCPVDTGALRDSIAQNVEDAPNGVNGSVSAGMYYATYVEFGTGRKGDPSAPYAHVESWPGMVAQPYMRPALDENKAAVLDGFATELGGAFHA
jgi:HK97 gp10 family phage protein